MNAYVPNFTLVDDGPWIEQMRREVDWDAVAWAMVGWITSADKPGMTPEGFGDTRDAMKAEVEAIVAPYTVDQVLEHGMRDYITPRVVLLMKAREGNCRTAFMGRAGRRKRRR